MLLVPVLWPWEVWEVIPERLLMMMMIFFPTPSIWRKKRTWTLLSSLLSTPFLMSRKLPPQIWQPKDATGRINKLPSLILSSGLDPVILFIRFCTANRAYSAASAKFSMLGEFFWIPENINPRYLIASTTLMSTPRYRTWIFGTLAPLLFNTQISVLLILTLKPKLSQKYLNNVNYALEVIDIVKPWTRQPVNY